MEVSRYNEAPYQGVSQAPPQSRSPSQAEAIENALAIIPVGAIKRPPFSWMGKLAGHPGTANGVFELAAREGNASDAILTITREATVTVPRLYAYTGLGALAIAISADAQTYLNSGVTNPLSDFRAVSVVDFTFITNRNVLPANAVTRNAVRPHEGMLWVRAAAYSRKYVVTVTPAGGGATTVTLVTPNGANATDAPFVDTDAIAAALLSGAYTAVDGASIAGSLGAIAGFTTSRIGSVIYLSHPTLDFTLDVSDGQGGTAFIAIKDKVQNFSSLPAKVPVDGFTVRITQQLSDNRDDFFVQFQQTAGLGTGVWAECLAPNALLGLDAKTMPMGLFNDGSWKLQVMTWKQRTTGDEVLVADPDFIGLPIEDITYWRGRLGILAGEGVTLSAADDPFRTYPRSLSLVLDSDPIARVNPSTGVSTFRYGLPFESRLVAFGDRSQAQLVATDSVTPAKTDIDTMTSFEFNQALRPQVVNTKVYFVAPAGDTASVVYELQTNPFTNKTTADPLTSAVPSYLPSALDRVATCKVNYTIAYAASGSPYLYLHLFRYANDERVQNAFQRWSLPPGWTVGGMFCKNTSLFVLACNGSEAHVLMANLSPSVLDDGVGATMLTHLDFRVKDTGVTLAYDASSDTTLVTLPWPRQDELRVTVRAPGGNGGPSITEAGPGAVPEGFSAQIDTVRTLAATTHQVVLVGDWTACPLWFGMAYTKRIVASTWYVLGDDGKPRLDGRLQIRKLKVDVAKTGYLRVEVTNKGRALRTTTFEGLVLDDPSSLLNQAPSFTGSIAVPIKGQNSQIQVAFVNDSHFPSTIAGYEWRGEFNPKSQRV